MPLYFVATRHLIPICYNPDEKFIVYVKVATRHLIPICYNKKDENGNWIIVATRHLIPICYNICLHIYYPL